MSVGHGGFTYRNTTTIIVHVASKAYVRCGECRGGDQGATMFNRDDDDMPDLDAEECLYDDDVASLFVFEELAEAALESTPFPMSDVTTLAWGLMATRVPICSCVVIDEGA